MSTANLQKNDLFCLVVSHFSSLCLYMNFLASFLLPDILATCTQYPSVLSGQLHPSPLRAQPFLERTRKHWFPISSLGTQTGLQSQDHFSQLSPYALTLCEAVSLKEKETHK